ncbi:hypothetical protein CEV34_2120 [Brucella pseudogrignonensis]|uniref:Uncharacterized protein n=1 Tax=Brucella pseudogrignonensis TaxID=419475 RepID=A0A256GKP8_9HYPH|nr:hypothetical protein CEV34_2120 [Brucella pseudogrignonensis]
MGIDQSGFCEPPHPLVSLQFQSKMIAPELQMQSSLLILF